MSNPPILPSDSEAIRRRFLNHEASLQGIGSLYLLGAVVLVISGVVALFTQQELAQKILVGLLCIGLGAAEGWIGVKLRKLDPVARSPATLLAILGLFAVPLGTLINAYVLYLLHSAKGKYVFSPEYRDVIAATPQIKYRMSIVIWILLGLLVVLILGALAATLFAK